MQPLQNKVAVITGATSGIGKGIALELAKEGTKLCLLGRNTEKLQKLATEFSSYTQDIYYYQTDLAVEADIYDTIKKIKNELQHVDILIHSAGNIILDKIENASITDFDSQYKINVRAPFLLIQAFLPELKEQKGQIVFINSSAGLRAGTNNSQYAATKHALKAIADSLRQEVNQYGIRVVSLFPGRTATPMQKYIFREEGREYKPELLMQPIDVAKMVIHVLSLPQTIETTDIMVRPAIKSY